MTNKIQSENIERILKRARGGRWGGVRVEELSALLSELTLIIPLPPYGQIQIDIPDDYQYRHVAQLFERASPEIANFVRLIEPGLYADKLKEIPDDLPEDSPLSPYWRNQFFPPGDARALYAIVVMLKPSLVIEVGSGNSTRFNRRAISDFGLNTKITSIDPSPRADITDLTDRQIKAGLLDVPLSIFDDLGAGDILFLDGSHVTLPGTDVTHYLLNILPQLAPGVIVHIHDVFLPWEYPPRLRRRQYSEQHAVAAMLLFSEAWDILLPVCYAYRAGMVSYSGGSLWLRKR